MKDILSLCRPVSQWRKWQPTPVLLPGNSCGWRSLVGCSPWGHDEQLHFHFSLSCIREGNGNPLQCSCLENPRRGEPGGLPSMGSHRVRHDWRDLAAEAADLFLYKNAGWIKTLLQNKNVRCSCYILIIGTSGFSIIF